MCSSLAAPRGSCCELRGGGKGEDPAAASAPDAQPADGKKKKQKKKKVEEVSAQPVTQQVSPIMLEESGEALAQPATTKKKKKKDKDVSSKPAVQQVASPTTPEELEKALAAGLVSPEQVCCSSWRLYYTNPTRRSARLSHVVQSFIKGFRSRAQHRHNFQQADALLQV